MGDNIYRSAIWKLTGWYMLLVMLISLMFSAVVYRFATDTLAQSLAAQQSRIYKAFPVFSGNSFFVHDKDLELGAHAILQNLIYFNILVLLIAGLAGYWLAQRTLRPIEASNERQKRFVADASHELRTPLTALKMSSEVALLDKNAAASELRTALQSNLEDADKLNVLLNDLLRLSQLESNQMQHSFTALVAPSIVDEAIAKTAGRAKAKHIAIHNNTMGHPLYGDQNSLVQLVVIILDNAIKYSPEHSSVTITSRHKDNMTAITIQDRGTGIEQQALQHVFDRFYRADKARTGSEGYGLGLSIAKHIADIHHGAITISSRPGKGTTVSLELPASAEYAA